MKTKTTKVTKAPKGSNVPSNPGYPSNRRSFGRSFKVLVAEESLSTPNATYSSVARQHNLTASQVRYWAIQYTTGLLDASNAVAFSTRPSGTQGKKDGLVNKRTPR